jgi:hypothetical protein
MLHEGEVSPEPIIIAVVAALGSGSGSSQMWANRRAASCPAGCTRSLGREVRMAMVLALEKAWRLRQRMRRVIEFTATQSATCAARRLRGCEQPLVGATRAGPSRPVSGA